MLEVDIELTRAAWSLAAQFRWDGGTLGVVGPSGAGKTTLLLALAGLERPDQGRIQLNGRVLFDAHRRVDTPIHRRRVATAFQENRLWPHLDVRGNLEYALKRVPRSERRLSVSDVAAALRIGTLLERSIQRLSGGEAKRVTLARAMLTHPELLLLDEPLNGLDPQTREHTLELIARVVRESGIATLFVSHRAGDLRRCCDAVLDIGFGKAALRPLVDRPPSSVGTGTDTGTDKVAAMNRWPVYVAQADADLGLVRLAFDVPGPLDTDAKPRTTPPWVTAAWRPGTRVGERVVAHIAAGDVVLSLAAVETVSMQNRLRGVIEHIEVRGAVATCEVALEAGVSCRAVVTRHAIESFQLKTGQPIWCLFKATAVAYQPHSRRLCSESGWNRVEHGQWIDTMSNQASRLADPLGCGYAAG